MQFGQLKRREFISLLGGVAAWPLVGRAQEPVIGWITVASSPDKGEHTAFLSGLNERGYIEGKNVSIEYRLAAGRIDRFPELVAELVARGVDVIIAGSGTPSALAAKAATKTVPIVFINGWDPVAAGLVARLNRPGGNLTGVNIFSLDVAAKRLQLLHELVPTAAVIGLLANPVNPTVQSEITEIIEAARSLGLEVHVSNASHERDFEPAFSFLMRQRAQALILTGDSLFLSRFNQLVALAARHRLPASYGYREFPVAGGLMSYGASLRDSFRLMGVYTGRILQGEPPAGLPVLQPTKFEFVLNLSTAKSLTLAIPDKLLALADEVIE
jgi:putative ABC transport system substrate-binding protein